MAQLGIYYSSYVNKLYFWEVWKVDMDKFPPYTMYCIEQVSDEMMGVLIAYGNNVDHQSTVGHMLYDVLSQKAIHNS